MVDFDALLDRLALLRARGIGGDDLEGALGSLLTDWADDVVDALRMLYAGRPSGLARWALVELDAEVPELEVAA